MYFVIRNSTHGIVGVSSHVIAAYEERKNAEKRIVGLVKRPEKGEIVEIVDSLEEAEKYQAHECDRCTDVLNAARQGRPFNT